MDKQIELTIKNEGTADKVSGDMAAGFVTRYKDDDEHIDVAVFVTGDVSTQVFIDSLCNLAVNGTKKVARTNGVPLGVCAALLQCALKEKFTKELIKPDKAASLFELLKGMMGKD